MSDAKQSKLGQELNRLMLESGLSPMEIMSIVMERGALNIGKHTFSPKPLSSQPQKGKSE